MNKYFEKRNQTFINTIRRSLWPFVKTLFRIKIEGLENVPEKGPLLFISNHNVGALLESHTSLFVLQDRIGSQSIIYGFTHPSIFKVAGIKHYFEKIGAVPATYEVAEEVFAKGHSLMIFPGGNKQALRPVWQYKQNHFEWSHGWAKIAFEHNVPVIPIAFKGSHFVNPVLVSGEWLSKLLILPWILGMKLASISLGQILVAIGSFFLFRYYEVSLIINLICTYFLFIFSPLVLIIPYPIKMKIYPKLEPSQLKTQQALEDSVKKIMEEIYE